MSQIVYVNQRDVASREIYPGVRKRILWQGANGANAAIGTMGSYQLSSRWLVIASAELRRLADEPAESAFVQDRTNGYVSAGAAYRF